MSLTKLARVTVVHTLHADAVEIEASAIDIEIIPSCKLLFIASIPFFSLIERIALGSGEGSGLFQRGFAADLFRPQAATWHIIPIEEL